VDPEAGQFIDPVTSSKSIGSLPATGIVVGSNDIIILSSLFVDKYSFQYTKYYIYQRMYVNIYSTFSFSRTNEQSANISNIPYFPCDTSDNITLTPHTANPT